MRTTIYSNPGSVAENCAEIEQVCESYVAILAAQMEQARLADPKGEGLPCCIECGGFRLRNPEISPVQATTLQEILAAHGYSGPASESIRMLVDECGHEECSPIDDVDGIFLRDADTIARSGWGTCLELACYQAAAKRMRGDDRYCAVRVTPCYSPNGTRRSGYRAVVVNSSANINEGHRDQIDDPVTTARREQNCGCDGHEEQVA